MWLVSKEFRFEASHVLPHHDGKCARLHGHSWRMRVFVADSELYTVGCKRGMVTDFNDVKKFVQPLVDEYLDHHHLNDTTGLENPTCEELARWVMGKLEESHPGLFCGVQIDETCTSSCLHGKMLEHLKPLL